MAKAESNYAEQRLSEETTFAETPSSPAMTIFKSTGESILGTQETTDTNTIEGDGNVSNNLVLSEKGEGAFNFELIQDMYDSHIEGTFRDGFVVISEASTKYGATASTQKFDDSSSDFTAANNFVVGAWIKTSGFYNSENNGLFRITEVDASGAYVVVANGASSLVDETEGESVTIAGNYIRNGVTNKSYLYEGYFSDISKFKYFPGLVFGGMSLNTTFQQILTGSFSVMAQQGVASDTTISGSTVAATTKSQMTASANVTNIMLDNALIPDVCVAALNVTIDNGLRDRGCVGSAYSGDFGRGEFKVSGTFDYFFEDNTFENYKKNHTEIGLSWRATDAAGNVMIFTVPGLYLNNGGPTADAKNQDVTPSMAWDAIGVTVGTDKFTMQIDSFDV